MVLLVVVVLGAPKNAVASPPSVQPPYGAQSGGVFTGPYTFNTYISCSGGFSFSNSYSNSLDGTHTFSFWGSADGSLLVSIDGGGLQLVTSCGDPFTGPNVNVATYTVSKNTAPPATPTPTPAPTPTPTPPPSGGGSSGGPTGGGSGGSSGGGSSGSAGSTGHAGTAGATGAPVVAAGSDASVEATPDPVTDEMPPPGPAAPAATTSGTGAKATPRPVAAPGETTQPAGPKLTSATLLKLAAAALVMLVLVILPWRSRRVRDWLEATWRRTAVRVEPYTFRLRHLFDHRLRPRAADEPKRKGLFSHHHHSGKLLAHHHTSYPALVFLILLTTVLAAAVSLSTQAANSQLSLTVLGPPPTVGATIDEPADGDHVAVNTLTVRGTCPVGLMIEIYRNGVFAGSTMCDSSGLYNLVITLLPGRNDLVARDLDGLSQYGPDSATVAVYYDPPPPTPTPTPTPTPVVTVTPSPGATPTPKPLRTPTPKPTKAPAKPKPTPTPAPAPPFYLESDTHFYQGAAPSDPVSWQLRIKGGRPAYIITWAWGDGHQDTTNASAAGSIVNTHAYSQAGIYRVTVTAFDAAGNQATMPLVVVINGGEAGAYVRPVEPPGNLVYIWPLLVVASLMVGSFWLGERHKLAGLRALQTSG